MRGLFIKGRIFIKFSCQRFASENQGDRGDVRKVLIAEPTLVIWYGESGMEGGDFIVKRLFYFGKIFLMWKTVFVFKEYVYGGKEDFRVLEQD